jgi:hypothetical protein
MSFDTYVTRAPKQTDVGFDCLEVSHPKTCPPKLEAQNLSPIKTCQVLVGGLAHVLMPEQPKT